MFERGEATRPLVILLPGGGHLARIFYGHPGARGDDFLCSHLKRAGFNVMALSYPSDHPSIGAPFPEMTITDWAETCGAISASCVAREKLAPRVVAVGWSLAGRLARALAGALRRHGLELGMFIGLAAPPPMPGFGVLAPSDLRLAPSGLLDGSSAESTIFRSRETHLAAVDEINGRTVIPRATYARDYVTNSPINFRGETERYRDGALVDDLPAAIADQGSFDFADYPVCGIISGNSGIDMCRALTDAPAWGLVNGQALYQRFVRTALTGQAPGDPDWARLRVLFDGLTGRLSRNVDGGHLFFVGKAGASATAGHIVDLLRTGADIRRELSAILPSVAQNGS
jgi:hypothetical protein